MSIPAQVSPSSRSNSGSWRGPVLAIILFPVVFPVLAAMHDLGIIGKQHPDLPVGIERSRSAAEATEPTAVVENWQDIVEPVFNPHPKLVGVQMDNYELVSKIPNHPELYPETAGKPALGFTPAMMEVLFANTLSESSYHHLDPVSGLLNTSEKGCVGIMQGCNDICTPAEWAEIHTNIWCGAATLKWFWGEVGVDQNPYHVHHALAGYKGGFTAVDNDGDGSIDGWERGADGLPTINAEGKAGAEIAQSYFVWTPLPPKK